MHHEGNRHTSQQIKKIIVFAPLSMSQVGAHIYAKATFVVFVIVLLALASIFASFFIVGPREVSLPPSAVFNGTAQTVANYTSIQLGTLKSNLLRKCQTCYQQYRRLTICRMPC